MTYETLTLDINSNIATITLNRPDAKNAMDDKVTTGLMIATARVKATPSLRVVFLTGNGPMFCAGGDPKGFQQAAARRAGPGKGQDIDIAMFGQRCSGLGARAGHNVENAIRQPAFRADFG